jgi:hypothetical protein
MKQQKELLKEKKEVKKTYIKPAIKTEKFVKEFFMEDMC